MPKKPPTKEEIAFQRFIQGKKVLIVDSSAASRSGLFRIMQDLGTSTANLVLANTFPQANEIITSEKPYVVIAEYDLGKRCGLELLQRQREERPEATKECIFVIVTNNTSQSAVARSAEEEVDAFVIKPYTPETVRKTLLKAFFNKIKPPQYVTEIEAGKAAMESGDLDGAEAKFKAAATMDSTPALAYYYLGQLKQIRKILDQAQGSFETGLKYNRIHYKCLVGLFDLLQSQKKYHQAYDVVKKISQYFPANPKRLSEVLKLAIQTGQYDDIERYYNVFINIDDRDETLIVSICAALVVCGKHYLNANLGHSRALELFRKASVTASGRVRILKEIILALLDKSLVQEAESFLAKFPPDKQSSDDYALMAFFISNARNSASVVIEAGRALIAKGVKDERLFTVMIQRSAEQNLSRAVEDLILQAIRAFPQKKAHFESLIKKPSSPSAPAATPAAAPASSSGAMPSK